MRLTPDPEVERWPIEPDRFIVTYEFSGGWWSREGEEELKRRMGELGIDEVLMRSDKITLFGVRKGHEADVHEALIAAMASEDERRAKAAEEYERSRPEREAEGAQHKQELDEVRDAFRRAAGSDTTG